MDSPNEHRIVQAKVFDFVARAMPNRGELDVRTKHRRWATSKYLMGQFFSNLFNGPIELSEPRYSADTTRQLGRIGPAPYYAARCEPCLPTVLKKNKSTTIVRSK